MRLQSAADGRELWELQVGHRLLGLAALDMNSNTNGGAFGVGRSASNTSHEYDASVYGTNALSNVSNDSLIACAWYVKDVLPFER